MRFPLITGRSTSSGDIFEATNGFGKELGSRYTFLDIACAPGHVILQNHPKPIDNKTEQSKHKEAVV